MPRGGRRPGAGRPRATEETTKHRTHRSYKIAAEALERGKAKGKLTPIEVMLENMWFWYDKAKKATNLEKIGTYRNRSQESAVQAAPFCHTRLGTLELSAFNDGDQDSKITVEFVKSKDPKKDGEGSDS